MCENSSIADVLRAKSFVLVDDSGRDRARLNASEDSAVTFQLFDNVGRPRVSVQVDDDGNPSICLWTEHNAPAISLSINRDVGNGISVGDAEGRPHIHIGVPALDANDELAPYLSVSDCDGRQIFSTIE